MSLLLFGVTGNTGKHVLTAAIKKGDKKVVCFVRNPSKIPADQRSKITIIEGDYMDENAVKRAVIDTKPSSIIITTTVPAGVPLTPLNQIVVPRIVDALKQDNRLSQCSIIYLGGAFSKIPGESLGCFPSFLACCLVPIIGIKAMIADNTAALNYLYSTPPELKFSSAQMGMVSEGASKGKIKVKGTGGVVFADVGTFLVELAYDNSAPEVLRKGFLFGY